MATTPARKSGGRKRHIVIDTLGLLLMVTVTAASVQDRDGGRGLLDHVMAQAKRLRLVWADGGYAGRLVTWARSAWDLVVHVVAKPAGSAASRYCPTDGSSNAPSPG